MSSILCDPNAVITESFSDVTSSTVYGVFENEQRLLNRSSVDDTQDLIIFQTPSYIGKNSSLASSKQRRVNSSSYYGRSGSPFSSVFIVQKQDYGEASSTQPIPQVESELTWISQYQSIEAEEVPIWRGVFTPHHIPKILFSKDIEIEVRSLPTWKPRVVIESYRLEDDNE